MEYYAHTDAMETCVYTQLISIDWTRFVCIQDNIMHILIGNKLSWRIIYVVTLLVNKGQNAVIELKNNENKIQKKKKTE